MQLMTFKLFSSFTLELTRGARVPRSRRARSRSTAARRWSTRNGNEYRNRYIGVFRFRDGKISHWREFHNPEATKVL